MNLKIIFLGGLALYLTQFVLGMATGPLIHDGVLKDIYDVHASFWRPELNAEPPNIAALMPRWISVGLVAALVLAGIFGWIRTAFSGPGWKKGLQFGVMLFLINLTISAGWSGVLNLPEIIWFWWTVDSIAFYILAPIVLGVVAEKVAPE